MPFLDIFSKKPLQEKPKPKILVDHREKNSLIPSLLISLDTQVEFKQLPVADYIINNTAIERKTIADFKSSITNKRIFNQLLELKQYPHNILIIEGMANENPYSTPGIHENAMRGFILSIALEYQTPIIFTLDEKDTATYIALLAKKQQKSELSIRPSKILRTKPEQQQFILEGFPNIGPTKAKALLKKFKSLTKIFQASEKELEEILGKRASDFKQLLCQGT